jgi:hypothetical protein
MSESTEPQLNPPETPRRKSKPKFEVPADAGQPAAAGWVYREDSGPEPPVALPTPGPEVMEPIAPEPVKPAAKTSRQADPLLVSAVTMAATGLGLMTRIAMTGLTLVSAPVKVLRRSSTKK